MVHRASQHDHRSVGDAVRQAGQVIFDFCARVSKLVAGVVSSPLGCVGLCLPTSGFIVVSINKRRQLLQAFAFRHLALVAADLKIVVHACFFRT